ncbi:MAG: hypothetical protein GC203_06720 [Phenylobacterium sp.]|uniref:hypothetical protein n=1 Tax=Phenylobacterium sp. TaxID=1871053 RepID=UPI0025E592B3|nr:hypothetical protein [Phenylobacterium sp.]MBI1197539.1 hypothetical protein [Phenylobacterium sp.]
MTENDKPATPQPGLAPGGHAEGERDAWNRERYGSRGGEDRADYGSGWDRRGHEYGAGQDEEPSASKHDADEGEAPT